MNTMGTMFEHNNTIVLYCIYIVYCEIQEYNYTGPGNKKDNGDGEGKTMNINLFHIHTTEPFKYTYAHAKRNSSYSKSLFWSYPQKPIFKVVNTFLILKKIIKHNNITMTKSICRIKKCKLANLSIKRKFQSVNLISHSDIKHFCQANLLSKNNQNQNF